MLLPLLLLLLLLPLVLLLLPLLLPLVLLSLASTDMTRRRRGSLLAATSAASR
jgi:hypothetical protein